MKNLKRALSFALATVMLIGMMVVGASAAGFGDADEIVNTDAVNTMVALGIIKGKDNGNFDPEGIVTRAEMAKMICVALNGGKDPNLAGGGLYPDTKGHWASGYIDYCTNLGIVAGDTAGNFNPDKTVTGTEAAKMILIALGYNAETEKFVNDANWSLNINIVANTKDLYKDLAILPAEGLTRDNAAQMLWNGMDAEMVEYDYKLTSSNGDLTTVAIAKDKTGKTILTEKFDMKTSYGYMTGITYDKDKAEYTYSFSDGTSTWTELATITATAPETVQTTNLKSTKDFSDLYGMKVKVLSKNVNSKTTVYGMYAVDTEVLFEGVGNDIESATKFDGKTIEATGTAYAYAYNVNGTSTAITSIPTETAFKLIDNNGDGKYDIAVTYPVTVAKVTFVGKDSITAGNQTYKFKDCDIFEGVAKDDYVVVTAAANTAKKTAVVAKAAVETGTVEATKGSDVKLSGTWYTNASGKTGDTYALNKDFDLVVVNGFVYYAKQVTAKAKVDDVVYVVTADSANNTPNSIGYQTQKVQLMFTDGTKKIVTVDKTDKASAGTLDVPSASGNAVAAGEIYTYATDTDGNYELSQLKVADFDATNKNATKVNKGKTDGTNVLRFNDDSVVFVTPTENSLPNPAKAKVVSGATINKWADNTAVSGVALYANTSSGFNYVAVGKLTVTTSTVPGAAGDTSYGWVTAASSLVKSGTDYYVEMTIWNGTETVTVLAKGETSSNTGITSSTNVTTGNWVKGPVSYKDLGDGKISHVTALTAASYVTGYAGGKDIEIGGKAYEITDDTVILYVDTANNAGVEGGEISIADKDALGFYVKNVYAADITTPNKLDYIIVDVSNNLKANATDKKIANDATSPVASINIDETKKELTLNGATVAYNDFATVKTNGKITVYGAHYAVIMADGNVRTSGNLTAGDTIRVTAANGTGTDYSVKA